MELHLQAFEATGTLKLKGTCTSEDNCDVSTLPHTPQGLSAIVAKGRSLYTGGLPVPNPSPPTGTITFLFTDIEGGTKRW
jgi:hypothetical protein